MAYPAVQLGGRICRSEGRWPNSPVPIRSRSAWSRCSDSYGSWRCAAMAPIRANRPRPPQRARRLRARPPRRKPPPRRPPCTTGRPLEWKDSHERSPKRMGRWPPRNRTPTSSKASRRKPRVNRTPRRQHPRVLPPSRRNRRLGDAEVDRSLWACTQDGHARQHTQQVVREVPQGT